MAAAALLLAACTAPSARQSPMFQRVPFLRAGQYGMADYRTPALAVTRNGTLIAAFDAMVHSDNDLPSDIDVEVRTSRDDGRTWSAPLQVTDPTKGGTSDTSLIVDYETRRIFLFYNYGPPGIGFWNSAAGDHPAKTLHPRYKWSDDNGRTWHGPRDLLKTVKQAGWKGLFTASGHGIQLRTGLHKGRLLQPLVYRTGNGTIHALDIYSDDDGATWHDGASIGSNTDESKVVELANGEVMQNMRSDNPHIHARVMAISHDGGVHFGTPHADLQLTDPHVNAGIIRVDPVAPAMAAQSHWLLFSNPDNARKRKNLTIRLSCDDGHHWSVGRVVDTGPSAYSTLVRLSDGTFGILWENGKQGGTGNLVYAHFNLAWIGRCADKVAG